MKKFFVQAVFLIIVIGASLYYATYGTGNLPFKPSQPKYSNTVLIGNTTVNVDVADTQDKRAKGLGGRENLASNSGMLFVFDKADKYGFWMKGMKIALDFIWIKDGVVVDLLKNIQPPTPNQPDTSLPVYMPNQPVNMVLEVNSGFVDSHNIKVGDSVKFVK